MQQHIPSRVILLILLLAGGRKSRDDECRVCIFGGKGIMLMWAKWRLLTPPVCATNLGYLGVQLVKSVLGHE